MPGLAGTRTDLAVALVAYQDHPDFAMFRDACIAGYRSVRTISDADLALLPMFLLIRDMAQMGWFHQRPENCRARPCWRGSRSASAARRRTSICQSKSWRIASEQGAVLAKYGGRCRPGAARAAEPGGLPVMTQRSALEQPRFTGRTAGIGAKWP